MIEFDPLRCVASGAIDVRTPTLALFEGRTDLFVAVASLVAAVIAGWLVARSWSARSPAPTRAPRDDQAAAAQLDPPREDPVGSAAPEDPRATLVLPDSARPAGPGAVALDEVRFVAYRPRFLRPATWHSLLVYAHRRLTEQELAAHLPDPGAEVTRRAPQELIASGEEPGGYEPLSADATRSIPRGDELTFVPFVPGVEFNPPSQRLAWNEDVHLARFRMRAGNARPGETLSGRVSVYLGPLVVAEITLALRVGAATPPATSPATSPVTSSPLGGPTADRDADLEPVFAAPYRKIFPSYSHRDTAIVKACEEVAASLGDRYLRDAISLRAGETWSPRLLELIEEADVFQLFWSTSSMRSPYCQEEWEHALALGRPKFVRPTYWEDPLPRDEAAGLPPRALLELHMERFDLGLLDVPAALPGRLDQELERRPSPAPRSRSRPKWKSAVGALALLFFVSIALRSYWSGPGGDGHSGGDGPVAYLRAAAFDRPGFAAFESSETDALLVLREDSSEIAELAAGRTPEFAVFEVEGRRVLATDSTALCEYAEARPGFRVFVEDGGRRRVFRVGDPRIEVYERGEPDRSPASSSTEEVDGILFEASDPATLDAYLHERRASVSTVDLPALDLRVLEPPLSETGRERIRLEPSPFVERRTADPPPR